MLITFTILLTNKVKCIKLRPALSIASSWVRRQVQQIRGKPSGVSLCTCINKCTRVGVRAHECVCVSVLMFPKWAKMNRGKQGHGGADPMVISAPTCHTLFGMTQAASVWVGPPGVPTCHTHPSINSSCTKWVYPKWLTVHGSPAFYCMWPFIQLELLGHIKRALV